MLLQTTCVRFNGIELPTPYIEVENEKVKFTSELAASMYEEAEAHKNTADKLRELSHKKIAFEAGNNSGNYPQYDKVSASIESLNTGFSGELLQSEDQVADSKLTLTVVLLLE